MTIENLKQIAIKYATTKGSRVPLAPDELCNAVVQYFNEFLKITADINTIQVAVTEEGGNIVFTITGNTLDGKAFTPIVITVDHNDFVTNQEFEEFKTSVTKQLNNKRSVISSPASSYVVYTQANGLESNLPYSELANQTSTNIMARRANGTSDVKKGISGENVANMQNIADVEAKIPDVTNFATKDEIPDVSGFATKSELTESINSLSFRVEDTENDITTIQVQVGQINTRVGNTETNIAKINSNLNNKLDKITSPISVGVLYANIEGNDRQISYTSSPVSNTILYRDDTGKTSVVKGVSGQNVANMENIADVEAKIPDVSNFATKDEIPDVSGFATKSELSEKLDISGGTINGELTVAGTINAGSYILRGIKAIALDVSNIKFDVGNATYGINILSSNRPTVTIGENTYNIAFKNDIPKYTTVDSVIYDTTNGAIIAYNGANEIHIPLLAGENVTIDASEDNKKIVISAAGGGGTGDVTAAGNNTFTGENTFTNEITFNTMKSEAGYIQFGNFEGITENGYNYSSLNDYQFVMQKFVGTDDYYETVITADLITYKPAGNNNVYNFHFPNKSGTFALTSDIIKNPIYFISFYANDLSEPCHLIGTMMSKNSYGTGQKTNEEFAVMLADNLYVNSNEGLAAYGRLAGKDILCIYSEDGLSIRCLDEENSEVDLPTVMFFVMETEL